MTPYIPTLTQAGLTAIVNVKTGTIGAVEITEIGLTNTQFTVSSTLEALPGEIKRLPVSGDTLGDDVIHVEALDTSGDAYAYTGFALYTSTGLLFAVYGQADPIAQKAAASATFVVVDIQMMQGQSAAITFGDTTFLNPPATTESQGVVELATVDEAKEGTDDLRALTPATALAAVLAWMLKVDGAGSMLDADLLDGKEGEWYADVAGRLGFVPLAASAFTSAAILSRLGYVPFDSAGFTKAAILTLLGFTPQDAAASTFGFNENGFWETRPNGVMEQWGYVAINSGGNNTSGTITFPKPFADATKVVVTGSITTQPNGLWGAGTFIAVPADTASATFVADTANKEQAFGAGVRAGWRAIGTSA